MPDDEIVKTPEEIAAEAEVARKAADAAELARAISHGVVEGLKARAAEDEKAKAPVVAREPDIEEVDVDEIDRRIAAGEKVGDLLAKGLRNAEERARRQMAATNGAAVAGLQEVLVSNAREKIAHFTEYEDEITKIVNKVRPEQRTLKVYQDATAMVLGRPEVREKLVQDELTKVLNKRKDSAGAADSGGASRIIKPAGQAQDGGELAATEENLRELVGEDSYHAFIDLKRSRGLSLDGFAQRLGYADAKVWFAKMQANDLRSATEGLGLDR